MKTEEAEKELSVIRKIMEDSRQIVVDNGIHYIFWGVLVMIALIVNYILLVINAEGKYIGYSWLGLMLSGAIIDIMIARRQSKTVPAATFAGRLLGSLWLSSGIAMFIFGFVGSMTGAYNPVFICPVIATTLGISFFTSGAIQQLKWFQYLSLGWWGGAIIMFVLPGRHTLVIFAVMLLLFQIIPGIILNRMSKKVLGLKLS